MTFSLAFGLHGQSPGVLMKNLSYTFFLLVTAASWMGCETYFVDTSEESDETYVRWNESLPDAINELTETCHAPLSLESTDRFLDLRGNCEDSDDLDSAEAQMLYGMLNSDLDGDGRQEGVIEVTIPDYLYAERGEIGDFSWPIQNCYIEWDMEVYFNALSFETITAEWENSGLEINFDNEALSGSSYYALAWWDMIATAHCPSSLNEIVIQQYINNAGLTGWGYLGFQDVDASIDFVVENPSATNLTVTPSVSISLDDLVLTGIDLDALPSDAADSALSSFGEIETQAQTAFADALETQLESIAAMLEEQMEAQLPTDQAVCDIYEESNEFVFHTAEDCPAEETGSGVDFSGRVLYSPADACKDEADAIYMLCEHLGMSNCDEQWQAIYDECMSNAFSLRIR